MAELWSYFASGLSGELLAFLLMVAIVAGTIDTLAGGGGLLSIPALMASGVPPLMALGTNKFQGSFGTAMASLMMFRSRRVLWKDVRGGILGSLIGAAVGTFLVQHIHTVWLSWIVPAVLVFIALFFLFSKPPVQTAESRCSKKIYQRCIVPVIGWYDGFFGPGTGSFFALSGVSLRGLSMVDATAVAKVFNCSSNVASLAVFLFAGHILWPAAIVMFLGQLIGAWIGARTLFKINPNYLRYLVVIMSIAMLVRYVWTQHLV
ncbi:TSUP family transporter [Vibrio nitrifigilis]|uniref:Probable membrane transporter protein n=1 Tax=Vibrio nitrifigilis TaxID=2789781 RepID=A0ABS0GEY8_9VIBR|nr:TSUP family transporter [Vibrio nitrifigilis]MBF9000942.1 TSUP family transporter [Vibrio nitrifigilis]